MGCDGQDSCVGDSADYPETAPSDDNCEGNPN